MGDHVKRPIFSTAVSISNETLGPDGWKNEIIEHEAGQALDGGDLLLQINSRLISLRRDRASARSANRRTRRGRDRILQPKLTPFPASHAPGPGLGKIIFRPHDPRADTPGEGEDCAPPRRRVRRRRRPSRARRCRGYPDRA